MEKILASFPRHGRFLSTGGKSVHRWMGGKLLELAGFDDFLEAVGDAAGGGGETLAMGEGFA